MDIYRTPLLTSNGREVFTIYTKPYKCGGNCLYCFTDVNMPRSSLLHEDTIRAKELDWSPSKQLNKHFERFNLIHECGHKIALNILGGSFVNYSKRYLCQYMKAVYDFINCINSDTLREALDNQKKAKDKLVYIIVQASPNQITTDICILLKLLGITEVQLGVQTINESVNKVNLRPHRVSDVIEATNLLKSYGFVVTYHMMLGMVGAENLESEVDDLLVTLYDSRFCPDYLKIFPCIAVKGAKHNYPITKWFKLGWNPLSDTQAQNAISYIMRELPIYVGINRIQRVVSKERILYGPKEQISIVDSINRTNSIWHKSLMYNDIPSYVLENFVIYACKQGITGNFYKLEIENILYGFLRVEIVGDRAIIRELTVTGEALEIGQENNHNCNSAQHLGVGKLLIEYADNELSDYTLQVMPPIGLYSYFHTIGFEEVSMYDNNVLTLIKVKSS